MNDLTDRQLLAAYAAQQSEAAFAELVRRHVDFVYSAAVRLVRDAHAAQDVTQGVFLALAQNARKLTGRPALEGWLHGTTRNLAANAVRSEVRRRVREQEAAVMNELLAADPDARWEHIAPQLDDALGELNEPDREALLLRYFKNHDLHTLGATLGISDDAAQKRVSRAAERLRECFAKRGLTIGTSGLVVVISANAVQAAPVGLAVTISTAAATATVTAIKAIAMTTLQKTIIGATLATAVGVGIFEAHQVSQLREQNQMLQQQAEQLQREREEAKVQLAALSKENDQLNRNAAEWLKLRAETSRLRGELKRAEQAGQNKLAAARPERVVEQDPTDLSPVETYSAVARGVVPWEQSFLTGGWRTPAGKIAFVLAIPKRADDEGVVLIEAQLIEVSAETATKLGLDASATDEKETKLSTVLTSELRESLTKAASDTNDVAVLDAPRLTILTGHQAQISSMKSKATSAGEKYSVGPTLTITPTIAADGQAVELAVDAKLSLPREPASP